MEPVRMLLYRESVNPVTHRSIADDAYPWMGDRLISVADGAGGRSSALQTEINPALKERETAFAAAVQGILDPESPAWEDLKVQFEKNFFTDTFDMSRDYDDVGGRKSSYFGSRLANLFLREALEKRFPAEELKDVFDSLQAASEEERGLQLEELGRELAEQLSARMRKASENCGMKKSRLGNLRLMSTTYSGILFLEQEDWVDVLTVQAGDSQSYVLVRENISGRTELVLKLLQAPQEAENKDMTNLINADELCQLTCVFRRIPKPCAILCASDGCFDAFPSPALFERFLMAELRAGLKSGDMNAAAESMARNLQGRTSDDTSSMAFIAFDFDSRDIRLDMQSREDGLTERMELDNLMLYSKKDPPEGRLKYSTIRRDEALKKHAAEFWEKSAWVREQYLPQGSEEEPPQQDDKQQEVSRLRGSLVELVRSQWQSGGFSGNSVQASNQYSQIKGLEMEILKAVPAVERARDSLAELVSSINLRDAEKEPGTYFENRQQALQEAMDRLIAAGKNWENLNRRKEECRGKYDQLTVQPGPADELLIHLYCLVITGDIPRLQPDMQAEDRRQYAEEALTVLNREYPGVGGTAEEIEELVDELAVLEDRRPQESGDMYKLIGRIYRIKIAVASVGTEVRHAPVPAAAEAARHAFLDRPHAVVLSCWYEHRDTLDEAFVRTVEEEIEPLEQEVRELKAVTDRKQRMAEEYNRVYRSLLPGEAF